jgi:hypothetical protein
MFLAACFRLFGVDHYRAVMNVQIAADLLTCWLSSALAGRLFGGRARLAVLWLAALCPFTANYVAAPITETLVLTTIAIAFYGFARWQDAGAGFNGWLWVVAAALAWSILLRPDQGLLAAAILPAMLWRSVAARGPRTARTRAAVSVFAAALCVILPLAPWTVRNWRVFHVVEPLAPLYANDPGELAPLGFARWYRSWAIEFSSTFDVYWNLNGDRIEFGDLPLRAFDAGTTQASAELRRRTAELLMDYNATTADSAAIDARFGALGEERTRTHPLLVHLGLPVARLADMGLRPRTEMMPIALEWWRWSGQRGQTAFAAGYAAVNLAYFAMGLAGLVAWRRRGWLSGGTRGYRELPIAMAASILLRAALLLTIDNAEPRYTLEFFPVLLVWIGALFAAKAEA